jgi:hypothetical protein
MYLNSVIDFATVKITQRLAPDFDSAMQAILSLTEKVQKKILINLTNFTFSN